VPATPVVTTPIPLPPPTAQGKPRLRVKVSIKWHWNHGRSRILKFVVGRHPHSTTVRMECRGPRCPTPRVVTGRPGKLGRFVHSVLGRRYAVGDRIFLALRAAHYAAERAQITIRKNRRPAVKVL
jgi:hypothetical protein